MDDSLYKNIHSCRKLEDWWADFESGETFKLLVTTNTTSFFEKSVYGLAHEKSGQLIIFKEGD